MFGKKIIVMNQNFGTKVIPLIKFLTNWEFGKNVIQNIINLTYRIFDESWIQLIMIWRITKHLLNEIKLTQNSKPIV